MPVSKIDIHRKTGFQNDTGIKRNIRKGKLLLQIRVVFRGTVAMAAVFLGVMAVLLYHIVVPVKHIQAVLFMKAGEEKKHIAMGFDDLFHTAVFPQFVPVSQLNVGVTRFVIILQCGEVQVLVF